MPKEVIYGSETPFGDEESAISVAEVRWGRETGHVQIATRCLDRSTHEAWHPSEHERAVELARRFSTAVLSPSGVTPDGRGDPDERPTEAESAWLLEYLVGVNGGLTFHDGFFTNLDRRGINELIRQLRRARDQAYGRDE